MSFFVFVFVLFFFSSTIVKSLHDLGRRYSGAGVYYGALRAYRRAYK